MSEFFKINHFLLLISVLYLTFVARAQSSATNWYFGHHAALSFSNSPPSPLNNSISNAVEGCATISDTNGDLLFYSRGDTIFNKQHLIMSNGTGLSGYFSSTQSCIIFRVPGSQDQYYIFTVGSGTTGLNYSIVDMTLAAGMGSVTSKNIPVYQNACSEKIAATKHCNGADTWIIIQQNFSNIYRAYQVTSSGVNSVPVVSSIGNSVQTAAGHIKFSPEGNKIAVTSYSNSGLMEIFDFNKNTGVISNQLTLNVSKVNSCEFSPDGSKLYATTVGGTTSTLYQWNLCQSSASLIPSSQLTIYSTSTSILFSLQRAIDGKIYLGIYATPTISIINNPDNNGISCNFIFNGLNLGNKTCTSFFPNFVSNEIKAPFLYKQSGICSQLTFTPPAFASVSASSCSTLGYTVTGLQWDFGDLSSGSSNTSTVTHPIHNYSSNGLFEVKLIVYFAGCAPDTIRQKVNVSQGMSSILQASVTCNGLGTASINIPAGNMPYTYTWIPSGNSTQVSSGLSIGIHTIVISENLNCQTTLTVNITAPIQVTAGINTTAGCGSATATVTAGGGSGNYIFGWTPGGMSGNIVNSLLPVTYTVSITDQGNLCSLTKTFVPTILPLPTLALNGNLSVCSGQSTSLTISGADSYLWSNGSTFANVILTPTSSIVMTVTGTTNSNGCSGVKSVTITSMLCNNLNTQSAFLFRIFPNPFKDFLVIESEQETPFFLYNSFGRMIDSGRFWGSRQLDMKALPEGIYFLYLSDIYIQPIKLIKN